MCATAHAEDEAAGATYVRSTGVQTLPGWPSLVKEGQHFVTADVFWRRARRRQLHGGGPQ